MINVGVFWNKKDGVYGKSSRSYIIYVDGNKRVISFKFPEQLIYEIDKYVSLLGFKNRSDLLRLLLLIFLDNMRQIEKMNLFKESSGKEDMKIELSIKIGSSTVSRSVSILDFITNVNKFIEVASNTD